MLKAAFLTLTFFLLSQLFYGEVTRRSGPFDYFQHAYGTRDFAAANEIIDRKFAEPTPMKEVLTWLTKAGFECRESKVRDVQLTMISADNGSPLAIAKPDPKARGSVNCHYQFGGWLPYPDIWLVTVFLDANGVSDGLMKQRLAN